MGAVIQPVSGGQATMCLCLLTIYTVLHFSLKKVVRIYNTDYEGIPRKIGISYLKCTQEGYEIYIPKRVYEKAYTDRFCFEIGDTPGKFDPASEVLIKTAEKTVSARLEYIIEKSV